MALKIELFFPIIKAKMQGNICNHADYVERFKHCPGCGMLGKDLPRMKEMFTIISENKDKSLSPSEKYDVEDHLADIRSEITDSPLFYVPFEGASHVMTKEELEKYYPMLKLFDDWPSKLSTIFDVAYNVSVSGGNIILNYMSGRKVNLNSLHELNLWALGSIKKENLKILLRKFEVNDSGYYIDNL